MKDAGFATLPDRITHKKKTASVLVLAIDIQQKQVLAPTLDKDVTIRVCNNLR